MSARLGDELNGSTSHAASVKNIRILCASFFVARTLHVDRVQKRSAAKVSKMAMLYIAGILLCHVVDRAIDWAMTAATAMVADSEAETTIPSAPIVPRRRAALLGKRGPGIPQAREPQGKGYDTEEVRR